MKGSRGELRDRVIQSLSSLSEVKGLYLFGREVDGETDEYSDIDLVCCSNDPERTQKAYRSVLGSISAIRGSYLMIEKADVLVEMIILRDYSPYQKLDFSIVPDLEKQKSIGPFKTVYESGDLVPKHPSEMRISGRVLDLQNRMNDILFSIPRFTKCLFRRDFDMYRRWEGVVAAMCVLLYERHLGWQKDPRPRLNPFEYKDLYKALAEDERLRLEEIQPLNGRPDVATGFLRSLDLFIALYREKARDLDVPLDDAFIDTMRAFADSEIERFVSRAPV